MQGNSEGGEGMAKKRKGKGKLPALFEFPPEVVIGGVNLTVYEDVGCSLQNYAGILDYSETLLRVDTEIGVIRFGGEGFCIHEMNGGALSFTGRITSIIYENRE